MRTFIVRRVAAGDDLPGVVPGAKVPEHVLQLRIPLRAMIQSDKGDGFYLLQSDADNALLDQLAASDGVLEVQNDGQPLSARARESIEAFHAGELAVASKESGADTVRELFAAIKIEGTLRGYPQSERADLVARLQAQLTVDDEKARAGAAK